MNKFAEAFEKNNKYWKQECPKCKSVNKLLTKNVIKSKNDYTFTCTKCKENITIPDIPGILKDLETKMKKQGISVE